MREEAVAERRYSDIERLWQGAIMVSFTLSACVCQGLLIELEVLTGENLRHCYPFGMHGKAVDP